MTKLCSNSNVLRPFTRRVYDDTVVTWTVKSPTLGDGNLMTTLAANSTVLEGSIEILLPSLSKRVMEGPLPLRENVIFIRLLSTGTVQLCPSGAKAGEGLSMLAIVTSEAAVKEEVIVKSSLTSLLAPVST